MKTKKKITSMREFTSGYEKLIKGKKVKNNGSVAFERVLKNMVKQRGSK